MRPVPDDREGLVREALGQGWYHTIDLAPGTATPGAVDLRALAPRVLPRSLSGRALDVGTFDGFWAFELERRGATVVATDLERFDEVQWPPPNREALGREAGDRGPGDRFELARTLLGSSVRRVAANVYDLDAATIGGAVDFAVVGDLLLHLRDPVAALERVHGVLAPGATLLSLEQIDLRLTALHPRRPTARFRAAHTRMNWWEPNVSTLLHWLRVAGFRGARVRRVYRLQAAGAQRQWHVALQARA